MSKAHAFQLGDRVNVPGLGGVQGVVTLPAAPNEISVTVPGRHVYFVRWLRDDGWRTSGWFADFDLRAANPQPDVAQVASVSITAAVEPADVAEAVDRITKPRARIRRAPAPAASGRRASASRSGRGAQAKKAAKTKKSRSR